MHTSGGGARAAVEITGPARAAYADARRGLAALSAGGAVEGENGDPRGVQSRRGEECFDSGQPKGLVEAAVDGRARPTRAGNNLTSAASGSARRGVGVRRSGGSELKIHARVEQRRRLEAGDGAGGAKTACSGSLLHRPKCVERLEKFRGLRIRMMLERLKMAGA